MGAHFVETKVTNLDDVDFPRFKLLISEVIRSYNGYTQWSYRSRDRNSSLNLGLRYNYLEKFSKSIVEPRVTFTQQFLEHFSFELAGEFKHQTTSQVINFQNDFLGVEKRRWQLSNDETIPVITSKQGSVGFNFSNAGWLMSLEGYYKMVEGITTQSQGFQDQYEFVKTDGSYEVVGADVLLRKRIKNANFWLSYAFMNNDYTFDALPEKTFPSNLDITHTITFGSTFKYKGLSLSGGLNWHTGKPTTLPRTVQEISSNSVSYEDSNSSRLDDYMRVDFSALYDIKWDKVTLQAGVSVWNVLDETNVIGNYYRLNAEGLPSEFVQNSLGLTTNAVLRCYF
ncbi:MAG: TonB-dependent receptor [Flavobacteriaceae bacterium]|nr:TonB-dependent receptor [Flavobacteriaceae bacterium]